MLSVRVFVGGIAYGASKWGIRSLTRTAAYELARDKIRVNSVHPGPVATPMGGGDMVAEVSRTNETHPRLARMGTTFIDPPYAQPEQIADAVAWLASDEASFVTAEQLSVDGGSQHF